MNVDTISCLIGSWLLFVITGSILSIGSISVYMLSYFREVLGYDVNAELFGQMLPGVLLVNSITYPIGN